MSWDDGDIANARSHRTSYVDLSYMYLRAAEMVEEPQARSNLAAIGEFYASHTKKAEAVGKPTEHEIDSSIKGEKDKTTQSVAKALSELHSLGQGVKTWRDKWPNLAKVVDGVCRLCSWVKNLGKEHGKHTLEPPTPAVSAQGVGQEIVKGVAQAIVSIAQDMVPSKIERSASFSETHKPQAREDSQRGSSMSDTGHKQKEGAGGQFADQVGLERQSSDQSMLRK